MKNLLKNSRTKTITGQTPDHKTQGFSLNSASEPIRFVIGCMTGTSIDGLDAALVKIAGSGLEMKVQVIRAESQSFGQLAAPIRALAEQQPQTARQICELRDEYSRFHSRLLKKLMADDKVDLISVHGQTIAHNPPASWQLFNPSIIAHDLGIPVVFDLRAADLAHGGQGAPITPVADYILFADAQEDRLVVNLGGFCNVTRLKASSITLTAEQNWHESVSGFDLCACNHLLDSIARELYGSPFDQSGDRSGHGTVHPKASSHLLDLLQLQAQSKRSLGTGDEAQAWLSRWSGECSGEDLGRTACAALGQIIVNTAGADFIILAGGGVHNATLRSEIETRAQHKVRTTDEFGIPIAQREAVEMAILGVLCQDRIPITAPSTTGIKNRFVSGCWVFV